MTLKRLPKTQNRSQSNEGFSVLTVLFLATILSAIVWTGFASWHQLLRQNRAAGRRLQKVAANCPVQRPTQ